MIDEGSPKERRIAPEAGPTKPQSMRIAKWEVLKKLTRKVKGHPEASRKTFRTNSKRRNETSRQTFDRCNAVAGA
jgi:hypothetical protein